MPARLCARSPIWLWWGRFGGAKGGIDLGLNAARRQCRQPGLGPAGLDLVADLVTPLPNVGLGGRHHGVFNALVNHSVVPVAEKSARTTFCSVQPVALRKTRGFPEPQEADPAMSM